MLIQPIIPENRSPDHSQRSGEFWEAARETGGPYGRGTECLSAKSRKPAHVSGFGRLRVRAAAGYRTARGFVSGWWRLALDQSSLLEVKRVGGSPDS